MTDDDRDSQLLGWIAASSAILFTGTIVVVVLIQLLGPAMGLKVGAVSDIALGTLVTAVLTLTGSLGAREILKSVRRDGDRK
jgi:hypothetical protein